MEVQIHGRVTCLHAVLNRQAVTSMNLIGSPHVFKCNRDPSLIVTEERKSATVVVGCSLLHCVLCIHLPDSWA